MKEWRSLISRRSFLFFNRFADVDDCETNPCKNGGKCIDGINSYTCNCAAGYVGKDCETADIDECTLKPCKNGGVCKDGVGTYDCKCTNGYAGKNCESKKPI